MGVIYIEMTPGIPKRLCWFQYLYKLLSSEKVHQVSRS